MFEGIKRFFKIYPLPIFVLLLAFAIYYSIFEIIKRQDGKTQPLTEVESMLSQEEDLEVLAHQLEKEIPPLPNDNEPDPVVEIQTNNEIPNEIEDPKKYITSKVDSLNIREQPNTTSAIIGKLTPQLKAIILEDNGKWVLIGEAITQTTLGWVLKAYTKSYFSESFISQVQPSASQNTAQTKVIYYSSKVPRLNIRQEPSIDSPIVGKLTPADNVEITQEVNGWVKIKDKNTLKGWTLRRYLIAR
ncbi:SH3 domain-containing protein [Helicobacter mesocricetorum]|uniref:SH3 domain-containing protein n=1 Tax=Helicobacter mesocricetorum TaxID=87012 RepID=UPI000CF0F841|nr:SH3 domain-containing protein [Helicobacter mesocricetorum]